MSEVWGGLGSPARRRRALASLHGAPKATVLPGPPRAWSSGQPKAPCPRASAARFFMRERLASIFFLPRRHESTPEAPLRVRDLNPKGGILDAVRPASLRVAAEFKPDPSAAQGNAQPERKKHQLPEKAKNQMSLPHRKKKEARRPQRSA